MMTNKGLLSALVFSYYSSDRLPDLCQKIKIAFDKEGIPFEIIIIDDGSKDNSYEVALKLEKKYNYIRAYQLSKNYTTPYAQFAGLSLSQGDCAVFIPDDLQRPLSTVIEMYREWQKGSKVVFAYRLSRSDGFFSDMFSHFYYKVMNVFSEVEFPKGGTDGCLIDREVIDILNYKISPINTSTVVEVLRLGYSPSFVPYDRPKSNNKSRWTLKKKIRLALDTFFTSSSFPIKFISFVGLVTFLISLLSLPLLICIRFFSDNTVLGFNIPGWTTIVFFIFLFSGLILLSLGIIAEYIWRIYEEVKGRPGYIIKKKDDE